jgi:hypothetical protein
MRLPTWRQRFAAVVVLEVLGLEVLVVVLVVLMVASSTSPAQQNLMPLLPPACAHALSHVRALPLHGLRLRILRMRRLRLHLRRGGRFLLWPPVAIINVRRTATHIAAGSRVGAEEQQPSKYSEELRQHGYQLGRGGDEREHQEKHPHAQYHTEMIRPCLQHHEERIPES